MVRLLARVIGVGIETADMLVHEVLSRKMRDRRAVARYAGITGSPDESGRKRREKGLARAGNARVRRGMIQLAWRFLKFQKGSALAQWYRERTAGGRRGTRNTMIVALARNSFVSSMMPADEKKRALADFDRAALDLFDPAWYDPLAPGMRLAPAGLLSSRGCPAACTFCSNDVTGRRFRYRSAAEVAAEVALLNRDHGTSAFTFFDDSFAVGKRRVRELCDALTAIGSPVFWTCTAHPAQPGDGLRRAIQMCFFDATDGKPLILPMASSTVSLPVTGKG